MSYKIKRKLYLGKEYIPLSDSLERQLDKQAVCFGSGICLKNKSYAKIEDNQVRKILSKLPKKIIKEYGLESLQKELIKNNVRKIIRKKRMNYLKLTPLEAQKILDESRGMSKKKFSRLWEIAHYHHKSKRLY